MGETLRVDVVDTEEHLLEVVLGDRLGEGARVRDGIEELTTRDHLLGDVGDLDGRTVFFDHRCVFLEFEVLDNVLMVELLRRIDLLLEQLEGSVIESRVVELENLQGVVRAI